MTEQEKPKLEFDTDFGDWRVTGSYGDKDNIVFYYQDKLFRTITVPAYRIWNVQAHLDEFINELEKVRTATP